MMTMARITKKTRRRLYILSILTIGTFLYVAFNVFTYFSKINHSYQQMNILTKELDNLLSDEDILKREIIKLENPEYVARFAREKFLYSKDGEKILRIKK